jgi:tRNA modification GTPase
VAIVGEPNVGKSTLLNALLNEDRAIVSEIAGTTRDSIEDEIAIGGIGFRFIDTAGIRETTDEIEGLGIKKTFEKIEKSQIALCIIPLTPEGGIPEGTKNGVEKIKNRFPDKPLLIIVNKIDQLSDKQITSIKTNISPFTTDHSTLQFISAKDKTGIQELQEKLLEFVNTGALRNNDTIVTNSRHYDSLLKAQAEINTVQEGLNEGLTGDLLAIDIRQALHYFGEITGQVSNDEILGNIFANFCIGK